MTYEQALFQGAFALSLLFLYGVLGILFGRTSSEWIDKGVQRMTLWRFQTMKQLVGEHMIGLLLLVGTIILMVVLQAEILKDSSTPILGWLFHVLYSIFYWLIWLTIGITSLGLLMVVGLSMMEPRNEDDYNSLRNLLFGTAIMLQVIGILVSFGFEMSGWRPEVAHWVVGVIFMNMVVVFGWCAFFILLAPTKETV